MDLTVKDKTTRLLDENMKEYLYDLGMGKFLRMQHMNHKIDFIEIENSVH